MKNSLRIKYFTCESGDWKIIMVDGDVFYQGSSIPDDVWIELLIQYAGDTMCFELTDEDMRAGDYYTHVDEDDTDE